MFGDMTPRLPQLRRLKHGIRSLKRSRMAGCGTLIPDADGLTETRKKNISTHNGHFVTILADKLVSGSRSHREAYRFARTQAHLAYQRGDFAGYATWKAVLKESVRIIKEQNLKRAVSEQRQYLR